MAVQFKIFNDCVHGTIRLHPLCVKIIDTPEFQRLRDIKQLGTTYLVYPGGCNNRFEHSLGVCHLASLMVEALRKNSPGSEISKEEQLCVEIAGLCHDIGHGPFSHLWEQIVLACNPESKWKHEESSVLLFDYLIKKNDLIKDFELCGIDEKKRELIKQLIMGDGNMSTPEKRYLFQIVNNKDNDIDVDKWDYFLRDGLQLKLQITFDYQRLLLCSCIVKTPDEKSKGERFEIGFRNKELNNLWDMFRCRDDLHNRAYQHRVVKNLDIMLTDAFVEANKVYKFKVNGKSLDLDKVHENVDAYRYFSDHIFYSILQDPDIKLNAAKDILNKILCRKLYMHVETYHRKLEQVGNKDSVTNLKNNLTKKVNKDCLRFCIVKSDMNRHLESIEKVLIFDKNSDKTLKNSRNLDETPKNSRKVSKDDIATLRGPFPVTELDSITIHVFSTEKLEGLDLQEIKDLVKRELDNLLNLNDSNNNDKGIKKQKVC